VRTNVLGLVSSGVCFSVSLSLSLRVCVCVCVFLCLCISLQDFVSLSVCMCREYDVWCLRVYFSLSICPVELSKNET